MANTSEQQALARILRRYGPHEEDIDAFIRDGLSLDDIVFDDAKPDQEEIQYAVYCVFLGIEILLTDDNRQLTWLCEHDSCLFPAVKAGVAAGNKATVAEKRFNMALAIDSIADHICQGIIDGECIENAVGEAFRSHFSEEGCSWMKAATEAVKAFWRTTGPLPDL